MGNFEFFREKIQKNFEKKIWGIFCKPFVVFLQQF